MYKCFIQFDQLPKSLNKKLRSHHLANHRENYAWDCLVENEIGQLPPRPLSRANITIVRHHYQTLDYDGLVGSLKPVIDAFVSAGVLKDDSWAVTGKWNVDQKFRSKAEGPLLEVLIQEMPVPKGLQ